MIKYNAPITQKFTYFSIIDIEGKVFNCFYIIYFFEFFYSKEY
jgi:hypothetical protein